MKKRMRELTALMAIASACAFSFCEADVMAKEIGVREGAAKQIDVTNKIRPQDDFFGYVNEEALREAEVDPKYGCGSVDECRMITD